MNILKFSLFIVLFLVSISATAQELAIIIHRDSQSEFNEANIKKIFLGQRKVSLNGDIVIPLNVLSKERHDFNREVLHVTNNQLKSYWAKAYFTKGLIMPQSIVNFDTAKTLAANNLNVITYVPIELVDESVQVVLTLSIE